MRTESDDRTDGAKVSCHGFMHLTVHKIYARVWKNRRPVHDRDCRDMSMTIHVSQLNYAFGVRGEKEARVTKMYPNCLGKTIVFIGCSTMRDLANHMIQRVDNSSRLLSKPTPHILNGYFKNWEIHDNKCDATKGYGCDDCYCRSHKKSCHYSWVDFEAIHTRSQTTVIFSWKPNLYSDSDAVAFYTRFLGLKNAVVFIGKGLHDAKFSKPRKFTSRMQDQIKHLNWIVQKFSKSVTVVMRTPLRSRKDSENAVIEDIRYFQLHTWKNVRVIDAYKLSQNYTPYDTHHYGHDLHEATLELLCGRAA